MVVRRATGNSPAWAGDPPHSDEEARYRIRDAARRCIDRQGVNVGIAEVARELGVSRPTIYRHYPSTERLLVAVAADSIGPLLQQIHSAFTGFDGTLGDMIAEQMALLLEVLPREPYLGLLLTSGSANVFAKRMTSDATMALGREFVHRLPIDWEAHGYDGEALDELVELMTRLVQSFILDPGDRPRGGAELRRFLRRWVGTAVDAPARTAPERSVQSHTDQRALRPPVPRPARPADHTGPPKQAEQPEQADDEELSRLSAFIQFVSRRTIGPRQRSRMAIAARIPATDAEIIALRAMDRHGCRTVNDLAAQLELDRSTVSRVAGRLAELGLIHRETDTGDRRRVRIRLTAAGRRALVALEEAARNDLAVAMAEWNPAERRTLAALADRLRVDLERLRSEPGARSAGRSTGTSTGRPTGKWTGRSA